MPFTLRFDFRNPEFSGESMADRYAAALDMVEWAERLGCPLVVLSEHHGTEDGFIPSPIVMAAAMGARTSTVRFTIVALTASFQEPLRIAEDLCVLDNLTRGRVDVVVGAGYVREEFTMFDVPMRERPRRVTEVVGALKGAFSGKPFEFRGRTVSVTPAPFRPGGPRVLLGGASEPAARRAARIADGFVPALPEVWDHYRDEMAVLGHPDPGPCPHGDTRVEALAADPDAGWDSMAPFFAHEVNAYGAWQQQDGVASPYRPVADHDALRASGRYEVLDPATMVERLRAMPVPSIRLHPLCGGMPIELAWESLRLFEREVLPAFR
jgi:alkanesulfonate monooxygenase SsuD/methylene tetrahydromethanopterin reductase-like flavin-dependent oxidoreductase (luciferase family)